MSTDEFMELHVKEARHALSVNGVALAKRHINRCFPVNESFQQAFFRFMAIMPFLNSTGPDIAKNQSQKYLWQKAKRIYAKIGLDKNTEVAFMVFCMGESGDLPEGVAREVAEQGGVVVIEGNTGQKHVFGASSEVEKRLERDIAELAEAFHKNHTIH